MNEKELLLAFLHSQLKISKARLVELNRYLSGWGQREAEAAAIKEIEAQIYELEDNI